MIAFIRTSFAALVALAALATVPGSAQRMEQEVKSDVIVLPFEPELDKTYRYELSAWKDRDGLKTNRAVIIQELTYRKGGSQTDSPYSVTIANKQMFAGPERRPVPMNNPMVDLFGDVVLDLDAAGLPLRVANWDAVKVRLENSIPLLVQALESDPSKQDQARRFATDMIGKFIALTPEDAPDAAIKYWPAILGGAGLELVPNEVVEETYATIVPLTGDTIEQLLQIWIERTDDQLLRITMVTRTGAEQLADSVESLVSGADGGENTKVPENVRAELAEAGNLEELITIDHAPSTGMIQAASITRGLGTYQERAEIRLLSD